MKQLKTLTLEPAAQPKQEATKSYIGWSNWQTFISNYLIERKKPNLATNKNSIIKEECLGNSRNSREDVTLPQRSREGRSPGPATSVTTELSHNIIKEGNYSLDTGKTPKEAIRKN